MLCGVSPDLVGGKVAHTADVYLRCPVPLIMLTRLWKFEGDLRKYLRTHGQQTLQAGVRPLNINLKSNFGFTQK